MAGMCCRVFEQKQIKSIPLCWLVYVAENHTKYRAGMWCRVFEQQQTKGKPLWRLVYVAEFLNKTDK